MKSATSIDLHQIKRRVGTRSYQLGKEYFQDNAIFDAIRVGPVIKARCHGSSGGPYRVRATVEDNGKVREAHCSCPVGDGGTCKHVAAMLLTVANRPDEFVETEPLADALERRSKAELIALVRHMIRRQPELESLLRLELPAPNRKVKKVSAKDYQKQVRAVFASAGDEWGALADIADQLDGIREIGDEFTQFGDVASAAAVYEGLLDAILEQHEMLQYDESGSLYGVVNECVRGLGECLKQAQDDAKLREAALRELFEVWACNIETGGTDLGPDSGDLLIEATTPDERRGIAQWVREAMPKRGDDWAREVYGAMLADLQADTLDDEGFIRLCRETGRVEDLVERLLTLNRTQEAIDEAERAEDYRLPGIADLFVRAGHGDVAEGFVRKRARTSKDARLEEWLLEFYSTGERDLAAALRLAEQRFRAEPHVESYLRVKELATKLKSWDALRRDLLAWLEKHGHFDEIVRTHLHERDVRAALEALKHVGSSWDRPQLELDVAKVAERELPREAIELYRRHAERLIAFKNRGTYREAARLLVKVRDLHVRVGERPAWGKYLAKLRADHANLPALRDELAAVGL